jgi:hypothetical protein
MAEQIAFPDFGCGLGANSMDTIYRGGHFRIKFRIKRLGGSSPSGCAKKTFDILLDVVILLFAIANLLFKFRIQHFFCGLLQLRKLNLLSTSNRK